MPHGGINLTQVFYGDNVLRYANGHVETYRAISLTNEHYRPDNTLNKVDVSGWRKPSSFYHNRLTESMAEVGVYTDYGNGYDWVCTTPSQWSYATQWRRSPVFPQKLEDRCVNKALNKLLDDGAGLGEDFATWQQTADMVADKKVIIADSVKKFKSRYPLDWLHVKGLTAAGIRAGKQIPRRWLELQYGWVPALQDVDAGMRIVADRLNNNSGRKHVISRDKEETSMVFPPNYASDYIAVNGQPVLGFINRRENFRSLVRFDFAIGNPALHAAAQLGLINPVNLAWNLLPYSFVVDWFLPVDGFLSALSAPWGLHFIGGSITRVSDMSESFTPTTVPFLEKGGLFMAGVSRRKDFSMQRTALDSFPGPRMPHFKNPLSLGHFANATSLLATAFR